MITDLSLNRMSHPLSVFLTPETLLCLNTPLAKLSTRGRSLTGVRSCNIVRSKSARRNPRMAKLKLTVACDKYDYLQPLRDGTVQAEGIDLKPITVESGIRHERMFHHGEYDACEFSMSSYLVARGQNVDWLRAIPFFPRRMWGHKFCFIRAGSGIRKPVDLKGGRIGLRSYENTLALVTKGMLMNSYDLGVSDVTWVIVNKEHVGFNPPPHIKVEFIEGNRK